MTGPLLVVPTLTAPTAPTKPVPISASQAEAYVRTYGLPKLKAMIEKEQAADARHGTWQGSKYFFKRGLRLVVEQIFATAIGHGAQVAGKAVAPLTTSFGILTQPVNSIPQKAVQVPVGTVANKIKDGVIDKALSHSTMPPGGLVGKDIDKFSEEAIKKNPAYSLSNLQMPKAFNSAATVAHDFQDRKTYEDLTKEVAHQIDMLCRAWSHLMEAMDPRAKQNCKDATAVALALYFFRRKYNKLKMFCGRLFDNYTATGGAFTQAGRLWDAIGPRLLADALYMLTWQGMIERGVRIGEDPENLKTLQAAALKVATNDFRMPSETKNYRA